MQTTTPVNDSEDFEILLNLLASDDVQGSKHDPENHDLKADGNEQYGKLDLKKIRSFYREKNVEVLGCGPAVRRQQLST